VNESFAIETHGLTKNYGSVRALQDLHLEVRRGEIYGFLGPNGAGKTTTIRCLLDMIRPNGGEIRVLGLDPQKDAVTVQSHLGYLPGELHLEENLTVEGTFRYFNALRSKRANWHHVQELAERLSLDMKVHVKNLSKGNKQKVGVVQALMHQPELLLLDEPTSGLDPLLQQEVLHLVTEACQQGATVFFSSHILPEVQAISDRVGIIRQGVLVEVIETQTLTQRALRRTRIRFAQAVDPSPIAQIPGVEILSQDDGQSLVLQVEGEMDALIKALAAFPVVDFNTELPSLEEIFLAYYRE